METLIMPPKPDSNERQPVSPPAERLSYPTPYDVRESMKKLKQVQQEQYTAILDARSPKKSVSPSSLEVPTYTHVVDVDTMTVHPEEHNSAEQQIEVHVLDTPVEETPFVAQVEGPVAVTVETPVVNPVVKVEQAPVQAPVVETPAPTVETVTKQEDSIPEEVIAEVAAKVSRKDFVKQQEDLFGAHDEVKAEDVPEGELTYEQYLAQRPVAKEGDFYHHNNRVYSAVPTGPMQNKKAIYEAKLDNSAADEHYEKLEVQANRNDVIDDAVKENEIKDVGYDKQIRINVEGESLVQQEPRLRGLLSVGEELLALHNSDLRGEEYDKTIKPLLDEKQVMYDDLHKLYQSEGYDDRALWYIEDKTNARTDPDYIPVEGSAYLNGEKVEILEFTETPDGKKAYTIEKADGQIYAVYTDEVTFKREFDKYEAPEEPDTESEAKLSRFQRTKKWFGKKVKHFQEYGGYTRMGYAFSGAMGKAGEWLTSYKVNEATMSAEEVQKQREKNRRHNIMGGAALFAAVAISSKLGFDFLQGFDGNDTQAHLPPDAGHASAGDFVPHLPAPAENADSVPMLPSLDQGGADYSPDPVVEAPVASSIGIDNPAFDIPSGGGGLDMYHDLGLTDDQWKQQAPELQRLFPHVLYIDNATGDIRFVAPGAQPLDFRQAVQVRN